jgi:hypothetical protein
MMHFALDSSLKGAAIKRRIAKTGTGSRSNDGMASATHVAISERDDQSLNFLRAYRQSRPPEDFEQDLVDVDRGQAVRCKRASTPQTH